MVPAHTHTRGAQMAGCTHTPAHAVRLPIRVTQAASPFATTPTSAFSAKPSSPLLPTARTVAVRCHTHTRTHTHTHTHTRHSHTDRQRCSLLTNKHTHARALTHARKHTHRGQARRQLRRRAVRRRVAHARLGATERVRARACRTVRARARARSVARGTRPGVQYAGTGTGSWHGYSQLARVQGAGTGTVNWHG